MRSCHCPVKVMCLGVISNSQEECKNFDGQVCLKRVSNQATATRRSTNQRFNSDDVDVNTAMMKGEWSDVVTSDTRAEEALDATSQHCNSDEHLAERLKLNDLPCNGKKKTKTLNGGKVTMGELRMKTRQDGKRAPLLLNEQKSGVQMQVGNAVEKDCNSCDSECMLRVMPEIRQAL